MDELYIVVELQRNGDQVANIVNDYSTKSNAHYNFHYSSAFAAISEVEKHAVSLLNAEGGLIDRAIYLHTDNDQETVQPKYIVIEYQINNGQPAKNVTAHNTLFDAEYKFHITAAAAAISEVDKHLVIALNDDGFPIEYAIFIHEQEDN